MNQTERLYKIDQLLKARKQVSKATFLDELGISEATFKRDLEQLRDRLHAPIVWDRATGHYRYQQSAAQLPQFQLPGLWLSPDEVHSLLALQQLLASIDPGFLTGLLAPMRERLLQIVPDALVSEQLAGRVRIAQIAKRVSQAGCFEPVVSATLTRQRLQIRHFRRSENSAQQREISPQRLLCYRDNWYLDAWCHLRQQLRRFAIDAIEQAQILPQPAQEIELAELERQMQSAYGIFAGTDRQWAEIRFSAERARWVQDEHWHPDQRGEFDADGRYRLTLPYSDDRELLMDILRHGQHAEVLAPASLRERVKAELQLLYQTYFPA